MRLEEVVLVLHRRSTASPSITGRTGLSRITDPSKQQMFKRYLIWNMSQHKSCFSTNILVTVMFTELLLFPPPASHQYSPLSSGKAPRMLQDDSVDTPHFDKPQAAISVLALLKMFHPVKSSKPVHFKERASYSKSCSRLGTIQKAASKTEKRWRLLQSSISLLKTIGAPGSHRTWLWHRGQVLACSSCNRTLICSMLLDAVCCSVLREQNNHIFSAEQARDLLLKYVAFVHKQNYLPTLWACALICRNRVAPERQRKRRHRDMLTCLLDQTRAKGSATVRCFTQTLSYGFYECQK